LEGRQTSKAFELINFRCWKGTSRDITGASNSEITIEALHGHVTSQQI
jgi:molybdopterin-binding protein